MCMSKRVCAVLHVLWSVVYVTAGAIQLVAGIFFFISLPVFKMGSNIWTGTWNIVVGIGGGMLSCVGDLTTKKQEALLFLTISILAINVVNIVLLEVGEWHLFMPDNFDEYINQKNLKKLVFYAHITTSISTAVAIITSFLDSQFTYCSMQKTEKPKNVHEQVSDIEYIIPRKKSNSVAKQAHSIYSQYAQSWVFDTDTVSKNESPYLKLPNIAANEGNRTYTMRTHNNTNTITIDILQGCETPQQQPSQREQQQQQDQKMFIVNPIVHVEQVSDDSNGDRSVPDRSLNYMKSFSRTPSPVGMSESSSQDSNFNPPIYECLERLTEPALYRSRLNTAISLNAENNMYQSPNNSTTHSSDQSRENAQLLRPRSETFTKILAESLDPNEKVQYASLMVELQQAFRYKKDKFQQQPISPENATERGAAEDYSEKTPTTESNISSRRESSQDESKRTDERKESDAEFSKELEAALQLIQDLESPNTIETPSTETAVLPGVVRVKWRDSDASESAKTLSECVSPVEEDDTTTAAEWQGKPSSSVVVVVPGSESSSGYSSPSLRSSKPTSVGGGSTGNLAYHIRNAGAAAVISLFSPAGSDEGNNRRRSVTSLPGPTTIHLDPPHITTLDVDQHDKSIRRHSYQPPPNGTIAEDGVYVSNGTSLASSNTSTLKAKDSPPTTAPRWKVKSLLKKKKSSNQPPVLTPEMEGAIFKSESLAYLTELELLARLARNKSIQRQIEQRVHQQISGHAPSESQC